MSVTSLSPKIDPSHLPLERLATTTKISEREKVAEVSKQFEAVLLKQILSQAQKPLFKSTVTGQSGASNEIYQDMVTQQLADRISRGGSFGFAKVLEKELAAQYLTKAPAEAKTTGAEPGARTEALRQEPVKAAEKKVHISAQPGKRI